MEQPPKLTAEYVLQLIVKQIRKRKKARRILFLYATWCDACKMQMEVLEQLVQSCNCADLLEVRKIIVSTDPHQGLTDEGKVLYQKYRCPEGVPCIVALDSETGRHVKTIDALMPKNIKKHLADIFEVTNPVIDPEGAEKTLHRGTYSDRAYKR
jgi:thiol-disulfide isomerase/thioredoxin